MPNEEIPSSSSNEIVNRCLDGAASRLNEGAVRVVCGCEEGHEERAAGHTVAIDDATGLPRHDGANARGVRLGPVADDLATDSAGPDGHELPVHLIDPVSLAGTLDLDAIRDEPLDGLKEGLDVDTNAGIWGSVKDTHPGAGRNPLPREDTSINAHTSEGIPIMYFTATITAYDVMDNVGITANVYSYGPDPDVRAECVYHKVTTVQGEGVDSPREWLKDALIALLEAL